MNYLIDTSFWIALYGTYENQQRAQEAEIIADLITNENILIPFPTMYEFLDAKFSGSKYIINFLNLIKRPNYQLIEDEEYRIDAMRYYFDEAIEQQDKSLVDEVIKLMLSDFNLKIDYLLSFDERLNNFALSKGIRTKD